MVRIRVRFKIIVRFRKDGRKFIFFNDALNTFYYGYMALDIW